MFVGGLIAWLLSRSLTQKSASEEAVTRATNTGVLLSSGFIAGEALMAVLLAFLVLGGSAVGVEQVLPSFAQSTLLGAFIFGVLYYLLVKVPLRESEEVGTSDSASS